MEEGEGLVASMFQVRIHGRGGQGVVTAAELLSVAAFRAGRHAQAFPSFGSERTGAPVVSFCRIADEPIRSHDPVAAPDALIIQDVSLLGRVDVLAGLVQDGYVLLNTVRTPAELGLGSAAGGPATRPRRDRPRVGAGDGARRPARCPTSRCSARSPR